ncbi:ribosomal-protein-alanine N-acetyltransferase [Kushneria sinocarnis]|uniref:Ribosomal-protein-alanine N-acetyltransferase n=1 Tax=Kushneria sinocarnis TaxID=595502 RepID=A0A420WXL7_9GAMM|nr:GNAT family N-acetyltransferase [Kushneria sinocarnis]RKR04485.1 ribosomal-protein-alanine N-acetyltransferase [Kushneria sinocarnis]
MMPVALGPAQAATMAALDRRIREDAWSATVYQTLASRPQTELWGMEHESGELVAMMVLAFGPWDAELELIGVATEWQGRGLGGQLLTLARQRLQQSRRERLLLEVRSNNRTARMLYERHGFRVDGCRRAYYEPSVPGGRREDALLMSLTLAASYSLL